MGIEEDRLDYWVAAEDMGVEGRREGEVIESWARLLLAARCSEGLGRGRKVTIDVQK
jgi:hypothetical protein